MDLPGWLPLSVFALLVGLAVSLMRRHWLSLAAVAVVGTAVGGVWGFAVLPFTDVIGHTYGVLGVAVITLLSLLAALLMSLVTRRAVVAPGARRFAVWALMGCCVAFGPITMALTPGVVAARFERNERAASDRVQALKTAVGESMRENSDPAVYCNPSVIRGLYRGPGISVGSWADLTHRYVQEDGYALMVYCPDKGGFRVDALPQRPDVDGRTKFH
jgi:hypothetical protein